MKYQVPRGTQDYFGVEIEKIDYIFDVFKQVVSLYNFKKIKTPVFEDASLFTRTIGEGSEIVTKQMYVFKDRAGRLLALRPEGTAPVVRAVVSNNLLKNLPEKFYYTGEMFRYERPQKDRRREFMQMGAEIFGGKEAGFDAELVEISSKIFEKLGIQYTLETNYIGCANCRTDYTNKLRNLIREKKDLLCGECRQRIEKNVLRVFDCKNPQCQKVFSELPTITQNLCEDCSQNFEKIKNLLDSKKIKYKVTEKLVRGLDYYNGFVFEFFTSGIRDAIGAGGRYDSLVEELGGRPTPACGFAIGVERILPVVKFEKEREGFLITGIGISEDKLEELAVFLRENFKKAIVFKKKKISDALKFASNENFLYAIIIGDDELKEGVYSVKNLYTGGQKKLKKEDILKL